MMKDTVDNTSHVGRMPAAGHSVTLCAAVLVCLTEENQQIRAKVPGPFTKDDQANPEMEVLKELGYVQPSRG